MRGKVVAPAIAGVLALLLGWFGQQAVAPEPDVKAPADAAGTFVASVFGDIEEQWKAVLGNQYRAPKLVLYTRSKATKGCGRARAAEGQLYCPDDESIYLDFSFFAQLKTKACQQQGDACEFARAYIIAHEFGHHVQKILGILARADAELVYEDGSGLAVRVELQADCFAGIWAGRTSTRWKHVTPAMIAAGMEAAQFGGDDHFGVPPSESTHGTAAQRGAWFLRAITPRNSRAATHSPASDPAKSLPGNQS